MLVPYALVIAALAAPPPAAVNADRPITRHVQQSVFTDASRAPSFKLDTDSDPVKNGAIIGAVVGAAVAAVGLGTICYLMHEPGTRPCWKDVLPWTVAGAGAGALAGAGVDAMFQRRFTVAASVRF
jgi:hypothetical protein